MVLIEKVCFNPIRVEMGCGPNNKSEMSRFFVPANKTNLLKAPPRTRCFMLVLITFPILNGNYWKLVFRFNSLSLCRSTLGDECNVRTLPTEFYDAFFFSLCAIEAFKHVCLWFWCLSFLMTLSINRGMFRKVHHCHNFSCGNFLNFQCVQVHVFLLPY